MKKIKGLLDLIRFELPLSAGICVIMGQLLALGKFPSVSEIVYGFLSVFFISASILVLNDYFDVETDKINAPYRPLPSNTVSMSEALVLSIVLLAAGLVLSYLPGILTLLCATILSIIGFLYNRRFKKSGLPGNLMVSFSVGMTFVYGAVSVGLPFNKVAWLFGLIAGLIDLGEEIAADAMDMKGDALIDSNSLAIRYGKQTAIRTSGTIFSIVIILSILPFLLSWFPIVYLVPIGIMDIVIAYSSYQLMKSRDDKGRIHIRRLYLGSTFGLVVFIVMRVFEV